MILLLSKVLLIREGISPFVSGEDVCTSLLCLIILFLGVSAFLHFFDNTINVHRVIHNMLSELFCSPRNYYFIDQQPMQLKFWKTVVKMYRMLTGIKTKCAFTIYIQKYIRQKIYILEFYQFQPSITSPRSIVNTC